MSFHNADNYGAVLQNYGLQKAIESMGYNVETIDYHCAEIEDGYKLWPSIEKKGIWAIAKISFWRMINLNASISHKNNFSKFRKDNLKMSAPVFEKELSNIENKYDVWITGSDQVWNVNLIRNNVEAYSLSFVRNGKKASYAASAGTANIEDSSFLDKIRRIDYVTVREKALSDSLEKIGINNKVVCDPVFLLSKRQWEKRIKKQPGNIHKYIFAYYLGSNRDKVCDIACYEAEKRNANICSPTKTVRQNLRCKNNSFGHGPDEFISDIANAELVVASSFHAIVFSIIFEKEFVTILDTKYGQRVKDLLDFLELSERAVLDMDDYIKKCDYWRPIDYIEVKRKMHEQTAFSMQELRKICEL